MNFATALRIRSVRSRVLTKYLKACANFIFGYFKNIYYQFFRLETRIINLNLGSYCFHFGYELVYDPAYV